MTASTVANIALETGLTVKFVQARVLLDGNLRRLEGFKDLKAGDQDEYKSRSFSTFLFSLLVVCKATFGGCCCWTRDKRNEEEQDKINKEAYIEEDCEKEEGCCWIELCYISCDVGPERT